MFPTFTDFTVCWSCTICFISCVGTIKVCFNISNATEHITRFLSVALFLECILSKSLYFLHFSTTNYSMSIASFDSTSNSTVFIPFPHCIDAINDNELLLIVFSGGFSGQSCVFLKALTIIGGLSTVNLSYASLRTLLNIGTSNFKEPNFSTHISFVSLYKD